MGGVWAKWNAVVVARQHRNGQIALATAFVIDYFLHNKKSTIRMHTSVSSYSMPYARDFMNTVAVPTIMSSYIISVIPTRLTGSILNGSSTTSS